jgi:hypothetical protein
MGQDADLRRIRGPKVKKKVKYYQPHDITAKNTKSTIKKIQKNLPGISKSIRSGSFLKPILKPHGKDLFGSGANGKKRVYAKAAAKTKVVPVSARVAERAGQQRTTVPKNAGKGIDAGNFNKVVRRLTNSTRPKGATPLKRSVDHNVPRPNRGPSGPSNSRVLRRPVSSTAPVNKGPVSKGKGKGGTKPLVKKVVKPNKVTTTKKPAVKPTAAKPTVDALMERAKATVSAELDPQIASQKDWEAGVKKAYADLAGTHATFKSKAESEASDSRSKTENAYGAALSQIKSGFDSANTASDAEKKRLGIQGDYQNTNATTSRNSQDAATTSKANSLGAQDKQSAAYSQLMSLLGAQDASSGTNKAASAELEGRRLEASRPAKTQTLYYTLQDQQKALDAEAAQQKFMNDISKGRLGVTQDTGAAEAIKNLGAARKSVADSKRPTVIKRPGKAPKVITPGNKKKVVKKKK